MVGNLVGCGEIFVDGQQTSLCGVMAIMNKRERSIKQSRQVTMDC